MKKLMLIASLVMLTFYSCSKKGDLPEIKSDKTDIASRLIDDPIHTVTLTTVLLNATYTISFTWTSEILPSGANGYFIYNVTSMVTGGGFNGSWSQSLAHVVDLHIDGSVVSFTIIGKHSYQRITRLQALDTVVDDVTMETVYNIPLHSWTPLHVSIVSHF